MGIARRVRKRLWIDCRLEGFWQNNLATFEEHGTINRRDEMTVRRNYCLLYTSDAADE